MRTALALAALLALAACAGAPGLPGLSLQPAWTALAGLPVPEAVEPDGTDCEAYDQFLNGFGTRNLAYQICNGASIGALAERAGVPVWTASPHRLDDGELTPRLFLTGPESGPPAFGRYDPRFVAWAVENGIPGEGNAALRVATQGVYDIHLRRLARVFWTARATLDSPAAQAVTADYERYLQSGVVPQERSDYQHGFTMNAYRDAAEPWARGYAETPGDEWETLYEAQTAYGFWVRRGVDGTADAFHGGLRRLLATYDADWLAAN